MTEPNRIGSESVARATTRRGALHTVAATGTTGLLAGLAGCTRQDFDSLFEGAAGLSGQTGVYLTPGGELRTGTLQTLLGSEIDNERVETTVSDPRGRIALSPDASEVAYIDGTEVVVRELNGSGVDRYSRTDLDRHQTGSTLPTNSIANGVLSTLAWCPASGSDRLAIRMTGGSEVSAELLLEFDRSSPSTEAHTSVAPNPHMRNVAWSPTCDRIAYKGDDGLDDDLEILDISSGGSTVRVSNGRDPAWGDTGVAFVRNGNVHLDRSSGTVQLTSDSRVDINLVVFDSDGGESLAFRRGSEAKLIPGIDGIGSNPNPTVTDVETDMDVTTFDIGQ